MAYVSSTLESCGITVGRAVSTGSATTGENLVCLLLKLLWQPGQNTVMATAPQPGARLC